MSGKTRVLLRQARVSLYLLIAYTHFYENRDYGWERELF